MAESFTIARPYAKALYSSATEGDASAVEGWLPVMRLLVGLGETKEGRDFLSSPQLTKSAFDELWRNLCEKNKITEYNKSLDTFFDLLLRNKRMAVLPEIATLFTEEVSRLNQTVRAEIISAKPLAEGDKQLLIDKLQARYNKQVSAEVTLDESLIAGAVIRIGDTVIDASVKGRMSKLRKTVDAN